MNVPPDRFGQDHYSTLAYLETRCVDHGGQIDRHMMRVDADRHPGLAHAGSARKHPTRLRGGVEWPDHDDYDCVEDLEAAGWLVHAGTGINPGIVRLTDTGHVVCAKLRAFMAAGGTYHTFFCAEEDAPRAAEAQIGAAR